MPPKTTCPISRQQFRDKAQAVDVTIAGQTFRVPVKEFSTGSLGWYLNGKTTINVDGTEVAVQIGLNLTIVGSKELSRDAASAAAPSAAGVQEAGGTDD